MPEISVYLPDDLYRAAREQGLSISRLTQRAVQEALRQQATDRWIDAVRNRPTRVHTVLDTTATLDEAREDFGA